MLWLRSHSLLKVVGALALCVTVSWAARTGSQSCERTPIAVAVSPNDDYVALVTEEVCAGSGIATTGISDVVSIKAHAEKSSEEQDVFFVEEHGDPENRPIAAWISPYKLQIKVPNRSLIELKKEKFQRVEISVKFDPDDPADRERWLKSLHSEQN